MATKTFMVVRVYRSAEKQVITAGRSRAEAVQYVRDLRWVQRNWSRRRSYTYRVRSGGRNR